MSSVHTAFRSNLFRSAEECGREEIAMVFFQDCLGLRAFWIGNSHTIVWSWENQSMIMVEGGHLSKDTALRLFVLFDDFIVGRVGSEACSTFCASNWSMTIVWVNICLRQRSRMVCFVHSLDVLPEGAEKIDWMAPTIAVSDWCANEGGCDELLTATSEEETSDYRSANHS